MARETGIETLSYAVRPVVVLHHFGAVSLVLGLLSLVPLLFIFIAQEWQHVVPYGLTTASLLLAGGLLSRLPVGGDIQRNEALVVVVLVFVVASLAFALAMAGRDLPFIDAWFEAVSGITTTGLSTIRDIESGPRSVIFTAAWLQWVGGLGIMVLGFALLFGQGINAKRLAGVLDEQTSLIGGTRAHARIVISVYLVLTLAGIAAIRLAGADGYDAVVLGLAAVSTGGYAPYNTSLAGLDGAIQATTLALACGGALGMTLYYRLWRRDWRRSLLDSELHALWLSAAAISAGVAWSLWQVGYGGWGACLRAAGLTALSAQTTSGFAVLPVASLDAPAKLLLVLGMLVGGGIGSTAGGIKLLRALVLMHLIHWWIRQSRLPQHAEHPLRFLGRNWTDAQLVELLLVVLLYLLTVAASWLVFLWYGYAPMDALFEVVSATGTVGLSTGVTGPELAAPLKLVLCLDMLLGRLEFLAVLVFAAPRTWFGPRLAIASNYGNSE